MIESELSWLIKYCERRKIGLELDIYIPSLQLAFELNGPLHYQPIYGEEKLNSILENDKRKAKLCLENNIVLYTLNVSQISHFEPNQGKQYLDEITNIINQRLLPT